MRRSEERAKAEELAKRLQEERYMSTKEKAKECLIRARYLGDTEQVTGRRTEAK